MKSPDGSAWICAICSAGFTRKTSARRHNNILHSSGAMIVRPLEYIIGRINGKFPVPHDPLSYRRNKKSQMNALGPNHYYKPIFDNREAERYYGNIRQHHLGNDNKRPLYIDSDLQNTKIPKQLKKPSPGSSAMLETKLKLEELKILLFKYHPAWQASKLLEYVLHLVRQGDHDFLDERLTCLRNIDRANRESE